MFTDLVTITLVGCGIVPLFAFWRRSKLCSWVDVFAVNNKKLNKKLHISLLLSAACLSCLQRNRQEGKLLAQVCALKHFHLCNKIAERAAPLHWAGQSKTLRSTKWWTAMRLLLQHDWLCLLGHSGVSCVKWSPLWRRIGPASALMQKIILSASRGRDERADM